MTYIEKVKALREALLAWSTTLSDEEAVELPLAFNKWHPDHEYTVGERLRYEDKLYRVLQNHTSQDGWNPKDTPSLFAEVLSGQDGEIGEWVQPDSTNPYMTGDKVTHNGKRWISVADYNVWEPGVYGWEELI